MMEKRAYLAITLIAVLLASCKQSRPVLSATPMQISEIKAASDPTVTPTAIRTLADLSLVGPTPYPTPGPDVTPWEQLVDQEYLAGVIWEEYEGRLQSDEEHHLWTYTIRYPSDWYTIAQPSSTYVYVQSIPPTEGPVRTYLTKFEMLRWNGPFRLSNGETLRTEDLSTVIVGGERGVLHVRTEQPDQTRRIDVVFQRRGVWIVIAGYVYLAAPSPSDMERHTAILLSIISSLSFRA